MLLYEINFDMNFTHNVDKAEEIAVNGNQTTEECKFVRNALGKYEYVGTYSTFCSDALTLFMLLFVSMG
jgi:hypothetical protein